MHISLSSTTKVHDEVTVDYFKSFTHELKAALPSSSSIFTEAIPVNKALEQLFAVDVVYSFLLNVSRADVFSSEAAVRFSHSKEALNLLRSLKLLKYCYNLPCGQLCNALSSVLAVFDRDYACVFSLLATRVLADRKYGALFMKKLTIASDASAMLKALYKPNADYLLEHDQHAIFPTSIYRQCAGHVTSSQDSCLIEAVMGTTITTTIEICRDVLNPSSKLLSDVYKPLGRCVAVVDERLDGLYGKKLTHYFLENDITFEKLVYRCMEVDKDISTVEKILVDLKSRRVSRNEPVLVVGGGVMADVGGFACALYHRNTPYVMLCTSIVSGIDAGPSPRTCCDGLGYKNVFGAYHPPILTLTDRQFFRTLEPGWIRHGIAEIIKMAVTKDASLFHCLEKAGNRLVQTKFGIENCEPGSEIDQLSESIIAKAMDGYVRSEYGNLWETHQCRPHAYGHTWSPGFELQAGLLHGHAVAIGMGYGAYLSFLEGWISELDFHRILRVMSNVGLSLRHEILQNSDSLWASQLKMTEKRGGNLCAPIPRGNIGICGYLNELSRERLEETLADYQEIVKSYPREGFGIEPHCRDVGLEDPSTVKQHADNAVLRGSISNGHTSGHANGLANGCSNEHDVLSNGHLANGDHTNDMTKDNTSDIELYNKWIAEKQQDRNADEHTSSAIGSKFTSISREDTPHPPEFEQSTLFHNGAEEYACAMSSAPSHDFEVIAEETDKANLFAPCMVGAVEGQFLKMMAQVSGASRILDIGTFTGYSALAFAEGMCADGRVITIEADAKAAAVARSCFARSKNGNKITLVETDARSAVVAMAEAGEKFDIVFLDADKTNYRHYYEAGLKLLRDGGILMADNALCALVYGNDDPVRQSLHEFAQYVRADNRTEQVMLTIREGVLVVRKVNNVQS
ncbi:2-epi-5-epi-valiolone synthase [Gracilariopsis chorda]|uniref:2-epi-5-epi-valiolone synthase n=1 Tax=Gracilariopsis chorda TaxID=448386 RepID=A0A2V3IXE4_9FLOR|nr:2-epi-5-epi-valiolone synthase [Gracilariopsis chorda]|eukprot:PXF46781.1 2-epi-5-epi-valiolone synthase [Gracilariopsis chorda]